MDTHTTVYNLMRYRKIAAAVSVVLIIVSIAAIATRGLNFGLDFTGGTVIEISFEQPVDLNAIRGHVQTAGYDASVVNYGSDRDILVRMQTEDAQIGQNLLDKLNSDANPAVLKRSDFVGPQVGEELRDDGGLALLAALLVVMVYVAFRFQFKFSAGAVVALIHDVIISVGCFALFQWPFDLTVLAALLAVIGYSLNDTIVVSDRIRENFLTARADEDDVETVVNLSISQMLGRTLVTSLTTFFVVVVLYFFGGEIIRGFSLALIIGVLVGTYSSIYVAANVLLSLHVTRDDLLKPIPDESEYDLP